MQLSCKGGSQQVFVGGECHYGARADEDATNPKKALHEVQRRGWSLLAMGLRAAGV